MTGTDAIAILARAAAAFPLQTKYAHIAELGAASALTKEAGLNPLPLLSKLIPKTTRGKAILGGGMLGGYGLGNRLLQDPDYAAQASKAQGKYDAAAAKHQAGTEQIQNAMQTGEFGSLPLPPNVSKWTGATPEEYRAHYQDQLKQRLANKGKFEGAEYGEQAEAARKAMQTGPASGGIRSALQKLFMVTPRKAQAPSLSTAQAPYIKSPMLPETDSGGGGDWGNGKSLPGSGGGTSGPMPPTTASGAAGGVVTGGGPLGGLQGSGSIGQIGGGASPIQPPLPPLNPQGPQGPIGPPGQAKGPGYYPKHNFLLPGQNPGNINPYLNMPERAQRNNIPYLE